ncbi:MAG: extracellular solute-binding protein [Caldisericaceae bacterium]|nr:extracellular solute-binding protein [Caldisericaceae bacterium]
MEEKKRQTFWLILTALGVFVLAVYLYVLLFSEPVPREMVKLYYVDNISETHQRLIDRFNQRYAGRIEVIPVNLPFSKFSTNERKEILARSLRSKSERIDVFAVDIIWTQRFAKWSHPLDAYFNDSLVGRFLSQSLKTCYYKQHLMAAPLYLDIGLFYYREDLLKQFTDYEQIKKKLAQRLSWDDFLQLGLRLKQKGRPVYLFPANNFEGLMCIFYELLTPEQINDIFLNDPIHLKRPEVEAALSYLHDLIYKYKLSPKQITNFDDIGCYNFLLQNDGFFVRGWPGFELNVQQFNETHGTSAKVGVMEVPYFKRPETKAVYGGWNLMVAENSKHKEEAVKFIKFLHEEENQKLLFTSGGYLPSLKSVYADSGLMTQYPEIKKLYRLLQNGQHRPMRSDYTRISDILSFYFHQFLKNEMTIQQALEAAENEINTQQTVIN